MPTEFARPSSATTLLVLLLLAVGSAGAATEPGLRAVFDKTRVEENRAAEAGRKSTVENRKLTARLTPTMLALREDDSERIFDFAARRVVILDHAKRSSYEFSLYAEALLRERELVNRTAISRGLAAIMGQKYDLVDAEAELSMLGDPPAKLKMTEARRGEERVFVINKREVVSFVPAPNEVPMGLAKGVDRLYLFEAQLHPRVRAALTAQVSLPSRLTYGFRLLGSQTEVTWQLREASVEDMEPLDAPAPEGGPAIHVQRSNQYVRLRNGTRGLEEFARALAMNPFIAGAWLDAGQLYYNGFAMPMAWTCWDAARTVAPGSALLRDVDEMEAALRRKHPEFF